MACAVSEGEGRWQWNVRNFNAGFAQLLRTGECSDLSFFVGPENTEFKTIRLFVAAKIPQLLNVKEGDVSLPPVSEIYLPEMSKEVFEILLNCINSNVIQKMDNQDLILDVYQAAIVYGQSKLREECEMLIKAWDINCDNVILMLQRTDVKFVQDHCWEFLRTHARAVLNSDSIMTALAETLVSIFEKGYFNGIPTMEVLTNIVKWSTNHYESEITKKDGKKSYKIVRNDLLTPLGEKSKSLMSWIGFQNLTPKELSQVCTDCYPDLLTDKEFKMLVCYAYAEGEKSALPEWA